MPPARKSRRLMTIPCIVGSLPLRYLPVKRLPRVVSWIEMAKNRSTKLELLQGTLDMMVMRTLSGGAANGYEIARAIERLSEDVLEVDHGSLYPALHRLEKSGWIAGQWETSPTKRRA